jgi:predicted XRE-type DNA-binding protein
MLRRSVSMLRKSKISIMARHRAKLTVEMAEEIRQAEGKQRDIAKRFGVSQATVSVIKRGLAWRDYNNPFALLIK